MTVMTMTNPGSRLTLDALVGQMLQPGFVTRFRRTPSYSESSGHVSLPMLAVSPPRSKYVRRWRRHARRCEACSNVFRYLGLSTE